MFPWLPLALLGQRTSRVLSGYLLPDLPSPTGGRGPGVRLHGRPQPGTGLPGLGRRSSSRPVPWSVTRRMRSTRRTCGVSAPTRGGMSCSTSWTRGRSSAKPRSCSPWRTYTRTGRWARTPKNTRRKCRTCLTPVPRASLSSPPARPTPGHRLLRIGGAASVALLVNRWRILGRFSMRGASSLLRPSRPRRGAGACRRASSVG